MKGNHHERCRDYYQLAFEDYLQSSDDIGEALDACLQRFLNQSPNGKNLTSRIRAQGLVSSGFWEDSKAVADSTLASLALSKILHYDDVLPIQQADLLANHNPDTLRWAIRYSGLFERRNSPIWKHLCTHHTSQDWQEFFRVCEHLLEQRQPLELLIEQVEGKLKRLSLLELLSYLSVLACCDFLEPTSDTLQRRWDAYDRIIRRKLKTCTPRDFRLDEKVLGKSLKQHLTPLLFPSDTGLNNRCIGNLEALSVLVEATLKLFDYEDSIDRFRFDTQCFYQITPGQSTLFRASETGTQDWEKTGHKYDLLWHYWMNRAMEEFAESDVSKKTIGKSENHDSNQLAYIKAMRSQLQLHSVYGVEDQITLEDGKSIPLFQLLLASELSSVFFDDAFIQPFLALVQTTKSPLEALSVLALEGVMQGENRFPMTWSMSSEKAARIKAWTACKDHPNGSIHNARAILRFWSNDLKDLSGTPQRISETKIPRLTERPYCKLGNYIFQFPWVIGKQNNLTSVVNNLRRLGARRSELQDETLRVEQQLGKLLEQRGFRVVVGYHPSAEGKDNAGEMDLICHLEGTVLLIEVKSGYIRRSRREIWLHKTSTLRKAAWQLKRKREALVAALEHDEELQKRLGYNATELYNSLHSWIVDTSIELDGQTIDGFPVISREALEVVLRNERHLLYPLGESDSDQPARLFSNGFSASKLTSIVEAGNLWQGL